MLHDLLQSEDSLKRHLDDILVVREGQFGSECEGGDDGEGAHGGESADHITMSTAAIELLLVLWYNNPTHTPPLIVRFLVAMLIVGDSTEKLVSRADVCSEDFTELYWLIIRVHAPDPIHFVNPNLWKPELRKFPVDTTPFYMLTGTLTFEQTANGVIMKNNDKIDPLHYLFL